MLSKTLEDGLAAYAIGEKIRSLRLKKKIGLVDLGKHTGLSPALLSKIETGKLFPTLPTLLRVAMVFGVGLEHFFGGKDHGPVLAIVRRNERQSFPESPGSETVAYHFESLDFPSKDRRIQAYLAEFHPVTPENARRHEHAGIEMVYLFEGSLEIEIGKEAHTLEAGDAITFDASVPHAYRRAGTKPCRAIVVSAP